MNPTPRSLLSLLTFSSLLFWQGCSSSHVHPPQTGDVGSEDAGTADAAVVVVAGDAGCVVKPTPSSVMVTASDGMVLAATWTDACAGGSTRAVVLGHMLCSTRDEWSASGSDWVGELGKLGIATLALDLRGHGGSTHFTDGSTHDLCKETDAKADMLLGSVTLDVTAGVSWLKQKGIARIGVIGASMAGNSSLVVYGADANLRVAIALSPAADYYGITPGTALMQAGSRPIVLEAADDDAASAMDVRTFVQANPSLMTKIWPTGGHGNAIIRAHPEELTRLVVLVNSTL